MNAIRSVQCTATCKRTSQQCRKRAILGAKVCLSHGGGSRKVRAAAQRRVSLAEALARADRRPAWQILADAAHTADVIARQMQGALGRGEQVTPEAIAALVDATRLQAQMAKMAMDSGADDAAPQDWVRRQAQRLWAVCAEFASIMGHSAGSPVTQAAFKQAFDKVVGPELVEAQRVREITGAADVTAPLSSETADAYVLALAAARAALAAGELAAAPAGRDAVADVDDPAELRRIVGALAFVATHVIPRRTRRGMTVVAVLDGYAAEVTWRAS